jgi:hypothetical protein
MNVVPYIDRILIRSYFYARLGVNVSGKRPNGWKSYINQFCNYDGLRDSRSEPGLRSYLCDKFGLTFESIDTMKKAIDEQDVDVLKEAILAERKHFGKEKEEILAYNDALHTLRVYSKRAELGEQMYPIHLVTGHGG